MRDLKGWPGYPDDIHNGIEQALSARSSCRSGKVDGFWIDATPVTNRQFAALVKATRHVTVAEKTPQAAGYPGALPKMLRAGSLVFTLPKTVVGPDITQ